MSFGWSAGDIVAALQFLNRLYKALDEASGAPEHYQTSTGKLRAIQSRLRYLERLAGTGHNPDPLTETEEASLLEEADKDDIRYVLVHLRRKIDKLIELAASGSKMNQGNQKTGVREWSTYQFNKLTWDIQKTDKVNGLIHDISELTAPLSHLHSKINYTLMKQLAATQGVHQGTLVAYLKAILDRVKLMEMGSAQRQLLSMNQKEEENEQVPLLHVGPELDIPPTVAEAAKGPEVGPALSHLENIAHEIMSLDPRKTVKIPKADHFVKSVFTKWYSGETSPRLWLLGDQASTVSAIAYNAALDQRRKAIAFSGRHAAAGKLLTDKERLFRLVYSLLFQLLQQVQDIPTLTVIGIGEPFTNLELSMESMPLALKYTGYILSLLPECVCVVDGWNFISIDAEAAVEQILKDFLDLFGSPQASAAGQDSCVRLLLTSRGNSPILRDLDEVYRRRFDLKGHLGRSSSGENLYTTLLGIGW